MDGLEEDPIFRDIQLFDDWFWEDRYEHSVIHTKFGTISCDKYWEMINR